MSLLSGIKLAVNPSNYGKLIGVAKGSGIKVFEKLGSNGMKEITSVGENGNVLKHIVKGSDETVVTNFVNGQKLTISHPKDRYSAIWDLKDGSKLEYCREPFIKGSFIREITLRNGRGRLHLEAYPYADASKGTDFIMSSMGDFDLKGTKIPNGISNALIGKDGKIIGNLRGAFDLNLHEKDLVQSVYNTFSKLLKM